MNKYIIIILIGILFVSCEEFLEQDPRGAITESYSLTADGAESAVLGLYQVNRDLVEELVFFGACGTDLFTYGRQGAVTPIRVTAAHYDDNVIVDNEKGRDYWKVLYNCVNSANYAVYSAENSDATDKKKAALAAEAKALRAFYYLLIVETYGPGAHFSIQHTTEPKTTGYQPGEAEIYKQILSDINDGLAQNLDYDEPGRLNEGVIKAMKAKILLSLAGHKNDVITANGLTKVQCFTQASSLCSEVINDYGYKLLDDFEQVFSVFNEENDEIIWAIQFTAQAEYNSGTENHWHRYFVPSGNRSISGSTNVTGLYNHSLWYGREYRWVMPTLAGIQVFEEYDLRKSATYQTAWCRIDGDWNTKPTEGDTLMIRRFTEVTQTEVDTYKDSGIFLDGLNHIYDLITGLPTVDGRTSYHNLKKHLDPSRDYAKDESGHKDAAFIRLGEIYLMKAEAEFHLGNNQTVADLINTLRVRAIKPGYETEMNVDASDITLDFLMDEYARETTGECFRWYTLKRNGALVDRVRRFNPDCSADIQDYHVNRPVPQSELDLITNKDFVQNTGY